MLHKGGDHSHAYTCRQTPAVYEQAATAYLVLGFQDRQPSLVRAAEYILGRLPKVILS